MMKPRWECTVGPKTMFLGGTEDFDLWYNPTTNYLIVLIGNGDEEWGGYPLNKGRIRGTGAKDENINAPEVMAKIVEKKREVERYIKLFAPSLLEVPCDA